jgi:riboflavin synthase
MFTGIIEEVGALESVEARVAGSRVRIRGPKVAQGLKEGDSICVNGVCLTAVDVRADSFGADVSPETLRRSNLGGLRAGEPANLERAMGPAGRFGGHIVQGHVDGIGEIEALELLGDDNWWLRVRVPEELDRFLVFKGSIAIDGISLTVASVEDGVVGATIIPHTYQNTNLGTRKPGDTVNLECDILAKYVEKMLGSIETKRPRLTVGELREQGF